MVKRKIQVSSERSVLTYNYLHSAAIRSLKQAEKSKKGRVYNYTSSIILSAFCIEAYLNHIGSELLPYWDEDIKKGLSIKNKLKIICHHLNFVPDYSHRPFHSLDDIIKYRNFMAHAITEKVTYKGTQMVGDDEQVQSPETWWEKHTNLKGAKRWLDDTESMIKEIQNATGSDFPAFGLLSSGSQFGEIIK